MHEGNYYKIECHKIYKLFNNLTASKFLMTKWTEANDLSSGQ